MVNYLCDLSLADQRLSADRPVEANGIVGVLLGFSSQTMKASEQSNN